MTDYKTKNYWEKNIRGFSGFYDEKSEEEIIAPLIIKFLYKRFLFPIEKKFMANRYNIVCNYIQKNVKPGMKVADVGCGNGIFTKIMANSGAKVYAIDFTQSALDLTKDKLTINEQKLVDLIHLDITSDHIPHVDLAISLGVLTYIDEIDYYFNNILPYTGLLLFNILDSNHILNIFRKKVIMFDVRNYSYHCISEIRKVLYQSNFEIVHTQKLATGFIFQTKKLS